MQTSGVEKQAEDLAAKQTTPVTQDDIAPPQGSTDAQIPLNMMGMSSPMDNMTSALRERVTGLVPKMAAARELQSKTEGDAAKAEAEGYGKYREELADIYKNYKPNTVDFGGKPNLPEQNPLKQFGSLASMLGIFASAFTKRPVVNALNASASAMNAARAGDMEAYHNAYKAWEDGVNLTLKKNQEDHRFLQDKLELAKTDNAAAMAEIKAYAVANEWPAASILAQAGDLEGLAGLAKSLNTANGKLGNFKSVMLQEGVNEFMAKNGRPPNFEEMAKIQQTAEGKGGQGDLDPDSVDLAARTYLKTGTLPALGYGAAATGLRKQVLSKAAEIAKNEDKSPEDIIADRAGVKADTMSLGQLTKMSDSAISFERTALENMKIAERLAQKGTGTSAGPVVNRWVQAGRRETGDPDVKAFDAAVKTVAAEYAKIMSGATGAGGATEGARAEANSMVSSIDSPEAIQKVFDEVMRPDMHNRKTSLEGQLHDIKDRIRGSSTAAKAPPINLLKKGVHTTFKNGQTWTLGDNGEPVQVQE